MCVCVGGGCPAAGCFRPVPDHAWPVDGAFHLSRCFHSTAAFPSVKSIKSNSFPKLTAIFIVIFSISIASRFTWSPHRSPPASPASLASPASWTWLASGVIWGVDDSWSDTRRLLEQQLASTSSLPLAFRFYFTWWVSKFDWMPIWRQSISPGPRQWPSEWGGVHASAICGRRRI